VHSPDKESEQGSSSVSSAHTAKESVIGSSAGKESVQGSSPANLASSGIYSEKSAKSGKDKWGDLNEEDTSKEDAKGLNEDDWVTTDEDEDESAAEAEAAEARKRRSDSIIDVRSASEQKEDAKGPGSASIAENVEDETQGSSSEPKEIAKGSEASSESKEAPQALSTEGIAGELHLKSIARGKAIAETFRAEREIAKGSVTASRIDENWASLGATFDHAAKAPGAYQCIFDGHTEEVTRESSPLLTHVRDKFRQAKPTAVPRIPLDQRLVDPSLLEKEESFESALSPLETGNPDNSNEDVEMQGEGNLNAASAEKNPAGGSSSANADDENLFIDRLVKLDSNGELRTHAEVLEVYLFAFGDHPEVTEDFVYNLTWRLANLPETPFETIITDYQEKQDELMVEQRSTIRNEMANMHRIMAERTAKNTAEIVKAMQAACDLKEKDLGLIRAGLKKLKLAHTLLNTDHALLKQKQATQSGIEEYAQCQKSLRAAQKLCNEKDSVIFLLEEQIGLLRDAIQTQGLDFPDETPKSAPAPAPSSNSMAPPQSRSRVKSHFEDAVSEYLEDSIPGPQRGPEITDPGWGNTRKNHAPTPNLDHGWGSTIATGPSPSPSPSNHNYSDSSSEPPRYGKNSFKKGNKGKGVNHHNAPQSLASGGKRGRESYEEDQRNREVRHKAWNSNGMSVANAWAKSIVPRMYIRTRSVEEIMILQNNFISADRSFQNRMSRIDYEKWHETSDDALLFLHKDLGMPIRFNVSPHFYYQAGVQLCTNTINIMENTEMLDKSNGEANWRIAFNVDTASVSIPTYFSQLGEDDKPLRDYRIAKHYLGLQERATTRIYELRRHHFYLITVVHNEKRPTHTFMDKNTHILMKRDFHRNKTLKAPASFNRLFDDAFKNHYTNIMQEIERFVTHNTPLEYTQRFTPDVENLYYYNDNCTRVRSGF
jgi:hypothetical protein